MELNPGHILARYERARVYLSREWQQKAGTGISEPDNRYVVCGEVTITPLFVFLRGHDPDGEILPGTGYPAGAVALIEDYSADPCEIHDDIEADAAALRGELAGPQVTGDE